MKNNENNENNKIFKQNKTSNNMTIPGISLPTTGGGLMRYNEEYKSRFKIKPSIVILFIILILALVTIFKIFFPIN